MSDKTPQEWLDESRRALADLYPEQYGFDDDDPERCPVCGGTRGQHEKMQEIANELREKMGLPPLDPPDMQTGFQKRDS